MEETEALVCEKPEEETTAPVIVTAEINNAAIVPALEIVAVEVEMSSAAAAPVNNYDKYVLNSMDGYLVETVYDVSLRDAATGAEKPLEEGESASVTLTIGTENARKLANQELLLVHIDGLTRKIYALDELIIDVEAGTVTFVTDSFSPFVLAAPPEQFAVTVDGKVVSGGCEVTVSANASYVCNLLIAVYDAEKMVAVKVVGNCNLTAPQKFELNFGAEADSVKVFLLEAGSGFVPRRAAAEDINLNT